jgi:hypothetical protein
MVVSQGLLPHKNNLPIQSPLPNTSAPLTEEVSPPTESTPAGQITTQPMSSNTSANVVSHPSTKVKTTTKTTGQTTNSPIS